MNLHFNPQGFIDALPLIGKGLLGVYAVTFVIILTVTIFNAVTSAISNRKKK